MDKDDQQGLFRGIFAPLLPYLGEIFVATLFVNLLAFAIPLFVLQIYDRVIVQAGLSTLQGLVIGMVGVIVFDFILRQARSSLLRDAALRIDAGLAKRLFMKFSALPLRVLERRPTSFWQSIFQDVDTVRTAVSGIGAILLADLPFTLIGVVLIIAIAPPLAWVLLVIIPLYLLLTLLSSWSAKKGTQSERSAAMKRDGLVSEMMTLRSSVKALGLSHHLLPIWEERQAKTIEHALKKSATTDTYHNLAKTLLLSSTVTLTAFGAMAIIEQDMSIGALIAANMLIARVLQPLNQLVLQWKVISAARQSYHRIKQVLAFPEDKQEATLQLPTPQGKVTMEGLSFAFGDQAKDVVIKNVGAHFGPGGLHAIVGPNGSGKSTLLKMMRGLYPAASGRILLDSGDLSQFSEEEKLKWIGYLPQHIRLFSGSIKDNLSMGIRQPSDEDIAKAAQMMGVHDDILNLNQGYDSAVGEYGDALSGGLRQRIGLTRTLVSDPAVLLLDEPTNNLDVQAERTMSRILKRISRNKTVIMVTHSMTLLEQCDSIMVLEKGQISAGGRAEEILPKLKGLRV